MNGYVFDPSRLACSPKQQERQGSAVAARMLRDYLDAQRQQRHVQTVSNAAEAQEDTSGRLLPELGTGEG
jgi:hypothetical protein